MGSDPLSPSGSSHEHSLFRCFAHGLKMCMSCALDIIVKLFSLSLFYELVIQLQVDTCKAKRGRRPRVRSTPIDNTYVQVKNECSLLCYRCSKSCPRWRLPVSLADPASMLIFVFPKLEPEHSVLHKNFLKASRVPCYSFISYLNS